MKNGLLALFALDQYIAVMTAEEVALIANGLWEPELDDIVKWEEMTVERKKILSELFSRALK